MIFFDKAAGFWFREKAVTAQAVRTSSKKTQPKMWQFPEQLPFFNILLAIILIFLCFKSLESIKDKVWSWWMHHPIFPLPPAGPGLRQRGRCRLCWRRFNQMSAAQRHFQGVHLTKVGQWILRWTALVSATTLFTALMWLFLLSV